jgi:hypothetical protein
MSGATVMQRYRTLAFAGYILALAGALSAVYYFVIFRQSYAWYMREFGIGNRATTSYLLSRQGFSSKEACEAQLRSTNRLGPRYHCARERLVDAQSEFLNPSAR